MLGTGLGTLLVWCDDRPGLVARTTGFFADESVNIVDAEQHAESGKFFQRIVFECPTQTQLGKLRSRFSQVASGMEAEYVMEGTRSKKVAILASSTTHCALGVLHRWRSGDLNIEPAVVISAHGDVEEIASWFEVPFVELAAGEGQGEHEAVIGEALDAAGVELVVLARYMRVLSPEFCERWAGRCINVHHSFLPAFVGASPYTQAYERGVKVIGATAHYVTAELDAGPIIAQRTTPVTHRDDAEMLERRGSELEVGVLVDAVAAHTENRVVESDGRVVVFAQ